MPCTQYDNTCNDNISSVQAEHTHWSPTAYSSVLGAVTVRVLNVWVLTHLKKKKFVMHTAAQKLTFSTLIMCRRKKCV